MTRSVLSRLSILFLALLAFTLGAHSAHAAGTLKVKSSEVNEVSGGWRIFVTIEMTKAPLTAHVPLKFLFTKTASFERSLVDGKSEPVTNRVNLSGQTPAIETLDVDFADGTGKIFKGTRFDFMLTRTRGFEAGEYKMQVRTGDGLDIGAPANITLKGDNEVVDRRSITFNAKDGKIKKVDNGVDAGAKTTNEDTGPANNQGDVAPIGTAAPFIPAEAYNKTPEEDIKVQKGGCGCDVPPRSGPESYFALFGLFALVALFVRKLHV